MNLEPLREGNKKKIQRLSGRRKAVTLIAAFRCQENILMCADREESRGTSKKACDKLKTIMAAPWVTVVANAGSAPVAELAMKRLQHDLGQMSCKGLDYLEQHHEQVIIDVLTRLHEDHIWKNPQTNHNVSLIIGFSFTEQRTQYLYVTEDNIPQPVSTYCCKGYGEDLCTYFAERLYSPDLNPQEMVLLAALIFREVNASVQFCGKGTDLTLLRPGNLALGIVPGAIERIQDKIPDFSEVMGKFWKSTRIIPQSLAGVLKEGQEITEDYLKGI